MRLPLVPTLMVIVAIPILIALGIWQLDRAREKDAMLAALATAPNQPVLTIEGLDWPAGLDFRRVRTRCESVGTPDAVAGRSADGQAGYSYIADCAPSPMEDALRINLGWDPRPDRVIAAGGPVNVTGLLRADASRADQLHAIPYLLIADPALGGLEPSLQPTIDDIPDNHMAYAFQWFGFAGVLAIIYGIYVRTWRRTDPA